MSDYSIEENDDGSAIVSLKRPVRIGTEQTSKLTIPALTGKHMRAARWSYGQTPSVGELIEFAAAVVLPAGAIDALPAWLARDIATEVALTLGKSRKTGEGSSSASRE